MTKVIVDGDVLLYFSLPREEGVPFEDVTKKYKEVRHEMYEQCFGSEIHICMSLPGKNFRKLNYPIYKADRVNRIPPEYLDKLKDWALENDPGIVSSQFGEADDKVLELAADYLEQDEPFVVLSVDKDLKTLGPMTYYNMRKKEFERVTAQEAYDFMLYQFVAGDYGDNVKGIYGLGYIKTEKLMKGIKSNEERFYKTKEIWQEKEPKDWEDRYNETCNLVFIRRRESHLVPLDFANMSFDTFKEHIRFCVSDYKQD